MGGYGSGAWRSSRYQTVEHSLAFPIQWLHDRRGLLPGCIAHGVASWTWGDEPSGSVGWTSSMSKTDPRDATLTLRYTAPSNSGERMSLAYSFTLIRTRPNYGGERWWIRCTCGRR